MLKYTRKESQEIIQKKPKHILLIIQRRDLIHRHNRCKMKEPKRIVVTGAAGTSWLARVGSLFLGAEKGGQLVLKSIMLKCIMINAIDNR